MDKPSARRGAIKWNDGQYAYVFGGCDGDKYFNDLWRFDGLKNTWQKVKVIGDKPSARGGAVAWYDDKYAYVFGGWDVEEDGYFKYLNDLWRFDATHNTWKEIIVAGDKPCTRYDATSWYDDKYLYIFGGEDSSKNLDDLWRFDGVNWEEIIVDSDKPIARHSATSWHNEKYAYVFGGFNGDKYLNDLWRFDGVNWEEVIIKGDKPPARESATSWHDGNYAYVFGGRDDDLNLLNDLWRYDANHNTWEEIIVAGDKPCTRENATSWYDDKYAYVFGGVNSKYLNDLWRFDGVKWEQIK